MIKIKKYQIEDYISDATQDALDLKADLVDGKVPASQLPSFVDDVIEVANYAALPIPGATGVIYITLDTNKVYRWTGSVYVEIASGVTNLSYTPGVSNGTVNSDTGTDATIPLAGTVNAGLFSAAEKSKLEGIAPNANVGVIPNTPITGATKTKITYDTKGLVTAGADATTADIADSTNKRYVTDANLTVINNTSGTNTGDQDLQSVTDNGASTTNPIIVTALGDDAITAYAGSGTAITGNAPDGTAVYGTSINGDGVVGYSETAPAASFIGIDKGIKVTAGNTFVAELNQGLTSKGLVINSGASSTGNFIELDKNGVDKLTINQQGELSIVKIPGGTGTNVLLDNGTTAALSSIGGNQNLQEVTDEGATTDNTITLNPIANTNGLNINTTYDENIIGYPTAINLNLAGEGLGINIVAGGASQSISIQGNQNSTAIQVSNSDSGIFINNPVTGLTISDSGNLNTGVYIVNASGNYGINQYIGVGTAESLNLGSTAKGLVINSGTSSTGNPIEINKNGVDKLTINQAGELTAQKLIKDGGFDFQFLKADGSVDNNTYLTSADLPSTLDLYATTSPDPVISGYTALVRNITDTRYNTVAVDVPTPLVNGTIASPTFCGAVISDPSVLLGNPGVFNFTVIGNIRRVSGSTSSGADFFFSIYKRDLAGTETFIADSAKVPVPANGGFYVEYISTALWNNGIFLSTDRIVLKFYGIQTGGGTGAYYEFLFGGSDPVRGTAAISSAIIPNIYLRDLADVEKTPALDNEILYWNDSDSLWEHSAVVDLIPDASGTQKGLVTTGTQTFAGAKTFNTNPKIPLNGGNSGAGAIVLDDGSGQIQVASNSIYPNTTELTYVKGVTSAIQTQLNGKQDTLTSGTNIRTVNGSTLLGSTNLSVGTVTSVTGTAPVVSSGGTTPAISMAAATGSVNGYLTSANWTTFNNKQDKSLSAYTIMANNTNATADATAQVFENLTTQTYSGTIVWTGGAAPTVPNHTYSLSQVGNLVTLMINLSYGTVGGTGLTNVTMELPSTAPTPALPSSVTAAGDVLSFINGNITTSKATPTTNGLGVLRLKSTSPNVFEASISRASNSHRYAYATIQYFV